ncbi:MAG: tetratricopeptide repeat protein [Bacteroidales bacterium]|jgi:tetratricopeptide (TPR) repeat protein|nr:tetratricopeptide repeat protein [Bacteroidales bacterium]
MGKQTGLLFLTILTLVLPLRAAKPDQLIEQANQAYVLGEYSFAIELYESVVKQKLEAPGLYYNLGNAYFKENKFGLAILNYERALRLKPGDEDIRFNLEVARSRTVDQINPLPLIFYERWWKGFYSLLSPNTWAVFVIILLVVSMVLFGFFFFSKTRPFKRVSFFFALLFLFLTLICMISARAQYYHLFQKEEAIVMVPRAVAKSAPDETSPDLFVIHEGSKSRITNELGDWFEVRLANGNVGWVKKSSVEII